MKSRDGFTVEFFHDDTLLDEITEILNEAIINISPLVEYAALQVDEILQLSMLDDSKNRVDRALQALIQGYAGKFTVKVHALDEHGAIVKTYIFSNCLIYSINQREGFSWDTGDDLIKEVSIEYANMDAELHI